MLKVIIAGGRDFNDYELLCQFCDHILQNQSSVEVVSGAATGADTLGERYAADRGHPVKRFEADWEAYGRSAGPRRNTAMRDYADALIAFWDGSSRGTKNMIDQARAGELKVAVKRYRTN